MELWVRAGAQAETPGEFGAAHFLEHTLFKGTKTRDVGEADTTIENLGATLNAATGPDYARYYTNVPSGHAAEALAVLADVVRNATLPGKEIERERGVILNELAQRRSDPESLLIDRLYAAAYRDHPYGRMPGGTEPTIRMQTRDTLSAFYTRCYRPDRCTLVLVGDIAVEQTREIAEKSFGDWAGRSAAAPAARTALAVGGRSGEPPKAPVIGERTIAPADVEQPILGTAYRGPAAASTAPAGAAQIVAALLGRSDVGGRLATPRLAGTGARVSFGPRLDPSLFIVTSTLPITVTRDRSRLDWSAEVAAQQQAIHTALDGLLTAPPTAGEVQAAKSALIARLIFESETNTGLAYSIGNATVTGALPPDEWRAAIEQTSLREVRQFIEQWLDAAHRIDIALTPAPRAGEPGAK
jgi:zinc protease